MRQLLLDRTLGQKEQYGSGKSLIFYHLKSQFSIRKNVNGSNLPLSLEISGQQFCVNIGLTSSAMVLYIP